MIQHDKAIDGDAAQQALRGCSQLERMLLNYFGVALAALAVYLWLVSWLNSEWVHQSQWLSKLLEPLATDQTDWAACALSGLLGLGLTGYWEKRPPSPVAAQRRQYWLQTIIRYLLAYIFLNYGFAKVFGNQFYSGLSTLDTPLGEVTGLQLTWRFFGYSYAYTLFVASAQLVSALLFFFRRTTTLGALILLPVISNIVFVNFTHQIPVKLYSSLYLIMTLYLLALDFRRLKELFGPQRPFAKQFSQRVRPLALAKYALIFLFGATAIFDNYYSHLLYSRATTPLHGAWEVEEYKVNEVALQPGSAPTVWQKLYFESDRLAAIKFNQPKAKRFFLTLAAQAQTIKLAVLPTEELFIEGTYQQPAPDQLVIAAASGKDTIRVTLKRSKQGDIQ